MAPRSARLALLALQFLGLSGISLSLPHHAQRAQIKRDVASVSATYDYIIVGGGTAGLTLADRLTEDGTKSVLVVEYGELALTPDIYLPNATTTLSQNARFMWNFTSIPQTHLGGRTGTGYAGMIVGGSSGVNGMFFDRPAAADLNAWAQLGNPGWDWNGLLPYFKKATTFTPPSQEVADIYGYTWDTGVWGSSGPVQATYPPYQWPMQKPSWDAWKDLGLPNQLEGVAGNKTGVFWVSNSMDPKTMTRSFARTAHYDPVKTRSNYHLLYNTNVRKIVFSDTAPLTAKGVYIKSRDGQTATVNARKEVILSAGTFGSPWILQRSGVGPKSVLQAAGINVRLDFPSVGSNFMDHPSVFVSFNLTKNPIPNPDYWRANATYNAETWQNYTDNLAGPYTLSLGNSAVFMRFSDVVKNPTAMINAIKAQDNAAYLPSTYTAAQKAGYKAQLSILLKQYASGEAPSFESPFASGSFQAISLQKPLSRGTITLNTTDPFDSQPVIDFHGASNPIDLKLSVEMFKYLRAYLNTPTMQSELGPVLLAPANLPDDATDAQIAALLESQLLGPSFAHPAGSCSMMPQNYGGVVGSDLLVYGVKKLSIVDASIIPFLPATHTCQVTYAIAEKAADIIKARA